MKILKPLMKGLEEMDENFIKFFLKEVGKNG